MTKKRRKIMLNIYNKIAFNQHTSNREAISANFVIPGSL